MYRECEKSGDAEMAQTNRLKIEYGNRVFVLPEEGIAAHLEEAGEKQLKTLLLLAMDPQALAGYPDNADELAARVGLSRKGFESAVSFWCSAGVLSLTDGLASCAEIRRTDGPAASAAAVSPPQENKPSAPRYSGEELGALMEERPELKSLISACQEVLNRIFSPADLNKIVELCDYLSLTSDYILTLAYYCVQQGRNSVAYIYKKAYMLCDDGVNDVNALNVYIRDEEKRRETEHKLRTLFGFGDRAFTSREREYLDCWLMKWGCDYPMLERAYEITINNTENHRMSMAYMNKVLSNWHDAGYKTVEEADNALAEYRRRKESEAQPASSFDTNEFFEAALKRSYGNGKG